MVNNKTVYTDYIGMVFGKYTVVGCKIDVDKELITLEVKCGNCDINKKVKLSHEKISRIKCRKCGRLDVVIPLNYYDNTNLVRDVIHVGAYQFLKMKGEYKKINTSKSELSYIREVLEQRDGGISGMGKVSILAYLKDIVDDMVDSNGNIRTMPIGNLGRRNLSTNRIKFIADFLRFLNNTDIINRETRIYIENKHMSIRGVNEYLNKNIKDGEKLYNENTTVSRIQYDKNKLTKIFGQSMFFDVLSPNRDISVYERTLVEQYIKYSNAEEYRKNLLLNIPENYVCTELSDEEFKDFMIIIAPYIRSQMRFIEENISEKACGYFNYLLGMPELEGIDKDRANMIKEMLA